MTYDSTTYNEMIKLLDEVSDIQIPEYIVMSPKFFDELISYEHFKMHVSMHPLMTCNGIRLIISDYIKTFAFFDSKGRLINYAGKG